jgi:microcompartment protein CcmK/EutM
MKLARVVGTLWGAKQSDGMHGRRVVEVRPLGLAGARDGTRLTADCDDGHLRESSMLALDPLGADVGQLVLIGVGSRIRDLVFGPHATTKACVIAIVDEALVETPAGEGSP